MKIIFKNYQGQFISFLFYAFLATALLSPLASEQVIPAILDYTNHIAAVIDAKKALAEGQFPLRVAPSELLGWRYPYYQFYSPSTYTFTALVYQWLTPSNPMTAVKFTLWCALILGGIYMQRLSYWLVKSRPAAILAAVVYLTAPYYVTVITGFGNLCETVALGLLPATLYYTIQRYLHPQQTITLFLAAFLWYLLITTHLVTFIYSAIFITLLFFLATCKDWRQWKKLLSAEITIAFGCLLAMWYLGPIGLLQKYFPVANTITNSMSIYSTAPSIFDLFYPGHLEFRGTLGNKHIAIGWPILMAFGLCCYALFNKNRLPSLRANYWLPYLLIIFIVTFLLAWSPINFWHYLPSFFYIGQYTWRLLSQLIWIGTLLFAWAVCWLFKNKMDQRHTIIGILVLVVTASAAFPQIYKGYFNINLSQFIKHPYAIFNPDAYTIEYAGFIDQIDTLSLSSLIPGNILQTNTEYALTQALLHYAFKPSVVMQGTIPQNLPHAIKLKALINNKIVAVTSLKPGKFRWSFPLNKTNKLLRLQFQTEPQVKENFYIPIESLVLTGFQQSSKTLDVKSAQPFCQQQKTLTICKMAVSPTVQLIELPILYYPKVLDITLNGKSIPYKGVVYNNHILTGITPESGKNNIITIRFIGLRWANAVSWLSWGLWISLVGIYLFRRKNGYGHD
jgi:hypothetical protein